jgi:hypothetical protein
MAHFMKHHDETIEKYVTVRFSRVGRLFKGWAKSENLFSPYQMVQHSGINVIATLHAIIISCYVIICLVPIILFHEGFDFIINIRSFRANRTSAICATSGRYRHHCDS